MLKHALAMSIICIFSSSCNTDQSKRKEIMDRIYSEIQLPVGSAEKDQYSQYYSYVDDEWISGVYIIYDENVRDLAKAACKEVGVEGYPCNREDAGIIDAGDKLWVGSYNDLPTRDGGGCSFVKFTYNSSTGRYTELECNFDH